MRISRGTPSRYTAVSMRSTCVHSGPTHASEKGTPMGGSGSSPLLQLTDTATRTSALPMKSEYMGARWCSNSPSSPQARPPAHGPGRMARGRTVIEARPRATCASRLDAPATIEAAPSWYKQGGAIEAHASCTREVGVEHTPRRATGR